MRNLIFCCLIFLLPNLLIAQTTIQGVVKDANTRKVIAGASIRFPESNQYASTDANGMFFLHSESPLTYAYISHVNYKTKLITFSGSSEGMQIALLPKRRRVSEVVVNAYESGRGVKQTAGSIAVLDTRDLQRFEQTSILPSVNLVPGVKMEERGMGGSRRINIRGSSLRSPFGVRNIKAYWNGIPLTSPDGSTPLEVMDATALSSIEIIKGPAASLYGSGNGGVMLFESNLSAFQAAPIHVAGMYGSDGESDYYRTIAKFSKVNRKSGISVGYVRQRNEGYRQQEFADKDQLLFQSQHRVSDDYVLSIFGFHYRGKWGLPGAIDSASVADNPRQAVPFAVENDTRVERVRTRLGISHEYRFPRKVINSTAIYVNFTEKENPYGTTAFFNGYKRESAQGFGGRTHFNFAPQIGSIRTKIVLGAEAQTELNYLREYSLASGEPQTLYLDTETRSNQFNTFGQFELFLPFNWIVTAGGSVNWLNFQHEDFFQGDSIDFSGTRNFQAVFSPRIAILKTIFKTVNLHASMSYGFSPPTLFDLLRDNGEINTQLTPEIGKNYEIGAKGTFWKNRLDFDVSAYLLQLDHTIVPTSLASGENLFENRGQTDQYGVEAVLKTSLFKNSRTISFLRPQLSYAFQAYYFRDYVADGLDLSDNRLTGVPAHLLNARLDLRLRWGIEAQLTYNFVGETPLNDENLAYAQSYSLLHAKVSYNRQIFNNLYGNVYVGANNLTNTTYSSFLQLNGFGGRYYNPSPPRNLYAGASLSYYLR